MDPESTDDCCASTTRRSRRSSRLLAVGAVGVALCCALPALLAGGVLAAAAGWRFGVWAAVIVAVAAVAAVVFRLRSHRQSASMVDPSLQLVGATPPRSTSQRVSE